MKGIHWLKQVLGVTSILNFLLALVRWRVTSIYSDKDCDWSKTARALSIFCLCNNQLSRLSGKSKTRLIRLIVLTLKMGIVWTSYMSKRKEKAEYKRWENFWIKTRNLKKRVWLGFTIVFRRAWIIFMVQKLKKMIASSFGTIVRIFFQKNHLLFCFYFAFSVVHLHVRVVKKMYI